MPPAFRAIRLRDHGNHVMCVGHSLQRWHGKVGSAEKYEPHCVTSKNAQASAQRAPSVPLNTLPRLYQLANFPFDEISFERANMLDVKLPVQVIDFMLECARQQI